MKNRQISIGCLGIAVVLAIIVVFGSESFLALIRTRTLTANITILDANAVTPDPNATPTSTPTSPTQIAALSMLADGTIQVHIVWNYKIGPRFPKTIVQSSAMDNTGRMIASDNFTIDCGNETLNCSGDVQRQLRPDGGTWASGSYQVNVLYSYAGIQAIHSLNSATVTIK